MVLIRKNFFKNHLCCLGHSLGHLFVLTLFSLLFFLFLYILFGLHLLYGALRTVVGTIRSGCTHLINLFLISLQSRHSRLLFTEPVSIDVGSLIEQLQVTK